MVSCRGASEEGAIPVSHLGYPRFGVEGLRFKNLQDHETQKALLLRPVLWSCGGEDSHLVYVVQVEFS
jgi:hypothetical protein